MLPEQLRNQVNDVPMWWHSIDLGHGIVTPGRKSADLLRDELSRLQLPLLRNKTVLDVGAWDGFYSFEAENRGASKVVALDHYVWSVDWRQALAYRRHCEEQGIVRREWPDVPEIWRPDTLPGKRGFDLARAAKESQVEAVVADFMKIDLHALGTFDIVFYFGVLYHMRHPLLGLERLAQVTRELAIIETAAVFLPAREDLALCEFYETTELNGDPSNWWAPNRQALVSMCRAAGFRKVEILAPRPLDGTDVIRYRLIAHAWK